jgi:hypothetical protein
MPPRRLRSAPRCTTTSPPPAWSGSRCGPRTVAWSTPTNRDSSAAATLRGSIEGLRSLLVDIHSPALQSVGLGDALHDLAGGLRSRSS